MIGFLLGQISKTALAKTNLRSLNVTEISVALHLHYMPYVKGKKRCKP